MAAFNWPTNSVRAIIVLLLVSTFCFVVGYSVYIQKPLDALLPSTFLMILVLVIEHYFKKEKKDSE